MTLPPSPLDDFAGKNVLLLQGPMGPFFKRFGDELEMRGATVSHVFFNPADIMYGRWRRGTVFNAPFSTWPAFLAKHLEERSIDVVFLFANNRSQHREAVRVARELGVDAFVFEEGYVRPNWLAIERNGVHGHSELPTDPAFYRRAHDELPPCPEPEPVGMPFRVLGWYTTWYSVANTWFGLAFPSYRHHWHMNNWVEAARWVRSAMRKRLYAWNERDLLEDVTREGAPPYFFVPLQLEGDYQLVHSPFDTVWEFIEKLIDAFAEHAPDGVRLVFKHHPVDRAYHDYRSLIETRAEARGIADRVVYLHDQDLIALLDRARGTITINSTVGVTSLARGKPTLCLGQALYAMEGLTSQGTLAEFLHAPTPVDGELFDGFCRYLAHHHHVNGSFYQRLRSVPYGAGVVWPPEPPWRSDGALGSGKAES